MAEVTLGDRTYALQPQRIGRIGRKLSSIGRALESYDTDGAVEEITGPLYEAIQVFIPDLDPEWKLAGYPSESAYAAVLAHRRALSELADGEQPPPFSDPYEEAADHSPTLPEIMDAVVAIFETNGGQRLVRLLKSLGVAEMLTRIIRAEVLRWARNRSGEPSPDSPS